MDLDELLELAEHGDKELKKSIVMICLYMIKYREEHLVDFPALIRLFLDDVQDRKLGALLCEMVTIDDFNDGYRDDQIPLLAKYASDPEWEKKLLLKVVFHGTCLDEHIMYAEALYHVGAYDEAREVLREGIDTFNDPEISEDILIMVKEFFPDGFLK